MLDKVQGGGEREPEVVTIRNRVACVNRKKEQVGSNSHEGTSEDTGGHGHFSKWQFEWTASRQMGF